MTAAALAPQVEYVGNGVTTSFPVPFRFLAGSLTVQTIAADGTVTTLVAGSQYAVTGGDTDAGGTVAAVTAPAAGLRVRIRRATPRAQETDLTTNDTFPAETIEHTFDRAMLIDQEQDTAIDDLEARAVRAPDGAQGVEIDTDTLAEGDVLMFRGGKLQRHDRASFAGKYFAGDGSGGLVPASGTGSDSALRSDLAANAGAGLVTWLGAATGALARTIADLFADRPSVMDFIPLVERVKIRLQTSTADLAPYFQLAAAAYPMGATLRMPKGLYNVSKVTIATRGIAFVGDGENATIVKKYGLAGAGSDSIGERGVFIVANLTDAGFSLERCTVDLNGEGPKGIGVAGRIANSYGTLTIASIEGITGPANAAIFGLRSSGISVRDVTVQNTGESGFLFRNCSDIFMLRPKGRNISNYGIEFSFVATGADGGSGTMPDRSRVTILFPDFQDCNDLALGSGNGGVIGGGGAGNLGAFYDYKIFGLSARNVYRGVHFEFQGGSYIDGIELTGFDMREIAHNAFGLIGARRGKVEGHVHNVGYPSPVALTYAKMEAATPGSGSYPTVCGGVLSVDFNEIDLDVTLTDSRTGGCIKRTDGVATAGNPTFTSAGATFAAGDVGKPIAILGAGPSGGAVVHETTIALRNSNTSIQLAAAPVTSGAGLTFAYGGTMREGFVLVGGVGADLDDCFVEGGSSSGLPSEPAAAAVRVQDITGEVKISKLRAVASSNGTHPAGIRMRDGGIEGGHPAAFTGKLFLDPANRIEGYTDQHVGTYTYRTHVVGSTKSFPQDRALAPSALANTYGGQEVLYPDLPHFTSLARASFEAVGAFAGGETVTFQLVAYFDDNASGTVDIALTAAGVVQVTAKQFRAMNPDDARIHAVGIQMKSSVVGSTVTGKANMTGLQG